MTNKIIKEHPGLLLAGIIIVWYFISAGIDYKLLTNSKFSNFLLLKEAYIGMKPIGLPLPETGIILFLLGLIPVIALFLLFQKQMPKTEIIKHIFGIIGAAVIIFFFLIPILVAGEVLYIIFFDKFCASFSWLHWAKDVADLFTFKAKIQPSFIKNPITVDMSLGGVIALYIGIPKIRQRFKI